MCSLSKRLGVACTVHKNMNALKWHLMSLGRPSETLTSMLASLSQGSRRGSEREGGSGWLDIVSACPALCIDTEPTEDVRWCARSWLSTEWQSQWFLWKQSVSTKRGTIYGGMFWSDVQYSVCSYACREPKVIFNLQPGFVWLMNAGLLTSNKHMHLMYNLVMVTIQLFIWNCSHL